MAVSVRRIIRSVPVTDLSMFRGDSARWRCAITDADDVELDLDGVAIRFTAKRATSDDDDDAVIVATLADGIVVTDESGGVCEVRLTPEHTADLTADTALLWDIQIQDAFGDVWTVANGALTIALDVGVTAP